MFKNYQGEQQGEKRDISPKLVKDYMTKNLITFSPDQTIDEVVKIIIDNSISIGSVVDDQHNLIGIISENECLTELLKGHYNNELTMSKKLEDFMRKEIVTVETDDTILDVANKFLNLRLPRFPVLQKGKLVGQISKRDIMHAIQDLKSEDKKK